jgi:hypothetical protein
MNLCLQRSHCSDSLNDWYDNTVPVDVVLFCNYHDVGSMTVSPVRKSQCPRPRSHFSFAVIDFAFLMLDTEGDAVLSGAG